MQYPVRCRYGPLAFSRTRPIPNPRSNKKRLKTFFDNFLNLYLRVLRRRDDDIVLGVEQDACDAHSEHAKIKG